MNEKLEKDLRKTVLRAVQQTPVTDIHTHLYSGAFGDLLLWGIDELLTYHYLVAKAFRQIPLSASAFFAMPKQEQADRIWQTLFLDNSPVSESCRGVLTALHHLGLDTHKRSLKEYRKFFQRQKPGEYIGKVFALSGVRDAVMTNDPFDPKEKAVWDHSFHRDPRFHAALRIDGMLNAWPEAVKVLRSWGFDVQADFSGKTVREVKRFLTEWIGRMDALYMAVSLPPSFAFPESSPRGTLIHDCVLPVCAEKKIPLAMMIGVKRLTRPDLRTAGDTLGRADVQVVEYLCREYPGNRFLVTMLSRENQHELCVAARKFGNLMLFGCWWFLNDPSIIGMMTRQRMELLGLSFIPQNSDARVLDQLIYKWAHSREVIAQVLFEKYRDLAATGWRIQKTEIERDVNNLFSGNFWRFLGRDPRSGDTASYGMPAGR